jgi:lysozyme family protein
MAGFKIAAAFALPHEDSALEFDGAGNVVKIGAKAGRVTVDSGGRTRFGIAERFHPSLPALFYSGDVKYALAVALDLLEHEYWKPLRLAELVGQRVASKIFDMSVDMGAHQAAIYAQRAAAIKEDGKVGDLTIKYLNFASPEVLMQRLVMISKTHYYETVAKNPQDAPALNGWLKRADDIPPAAQAPSPAVQGVTIS